MSEILCVTNRALCSDDFLRRIEKIAKAKPAAILLREKDLSTAAYQALAQQVMEICASHQVRCILHSFSDVAAALAAEAFHGPLPVLRTMSANERQQFSILGASCHSIADAQEAEALGCTYITAGHIFDTACKQGLTGRGLGFLQSVCQSVSIPVYAIGGINSQNFTSVLQRGASGICIMSGLMQCPDPITYLNEFQKVET